MEQLKQHRPLLSCLNGFQTPTNSATLFITGLDSLRKQLGCVHEMEKDGRVVVKLYTIGTFTQCYEGNIMYWYLLLRANDKY